MAPVGAVAGPLSNDVLPQIFAGGVLGHDPFGAGSPVVEPVGWAVAVGGAAVVVVEAVVVGAALVVVGTVVVGAGAVVGAPVGDIVGEAVGVGVAPVFATLKSARRLEVVPSDHVSTTLMLCDPLASSVVSYGNAAPLLALPAKSNGALSSVWTGGSVSCGLSK
jgi:hypothetical protein